MDWEEWEREYPAEEVSEKPEHYEEKFKERKKAESFHDYMEELHEVSYEVVKFGGLYYVRVS